MIVSCHNSVGLVGGFQRTEVVVGLEVPEHLGRRGFLADILVGLELQGGEAVSGRVVVVRHWPGGQCWHRGCRQTFLNYRRASPRLP